MHAATLDRLKRDEAFQTEQAVAIAEAIDMALADAQLVTIPIFEARLARVDARFDALEANMDARFEALESKMDTRFAAFESKMDARFAAMDARFEGRFETLDARHETLETRLDSKLASFKYQLTVIVVAAMLGSPAVPKIAAVLLNAIHGVH
jgi:hypothetical protein